MGLEVWVAVQYCWMWRRGSVRGFVGLGIVCMGGVLRRLTAKVLDSTSRILALCSGESPAAKDPRIFRNP